MSAHGVGRTWPPSILGKLSDLITEVTVCQRCLCVRGACVSEVPVCQRCLCVRTSQRKSVRHTRAAKKVCETEQHGML